MFTARLDKEIVVGTKSDVGVLWEVSKTVAEKGIDILAVNAWVEGDRGYIRLVTDDILRAREALERKKYAVTERQVVLVEVSHKPGMLTRMSELLMEEALDIGHLYASAASDGKKCVVVFSCSDNERAAVILNKVAQPATA